jgi:protein-ribulosamine 3-kinase
MEGEYTGMLELYNTVPHMIPKPHAWGKIDTKPIPTYFYICDFINITDTLPDPVKLGAAVAELHKKSVSPTGKFGFQMNTCDGFLHQDVPWESSWTVAFHRLLKGVWIHDSNSNGAWPELDAAMERTLSHVVPRLLGALEANQTIKPCLIHGDLWEGNIGTDIETGNIYIYDAAAYYAHNEMEIGIWRVSHRSIKAPAYRREYVRHFKKSKPVAEWDDRLALYSVKAKLMYTASVTHGQPVRQS